MNAFLMYENQAFSKKTNKTDFDNDLILDLELESILKYMSKGNKHYYEMALRAMINPLSDPSDIKYRQDVLNDFISNREILNEIYSIVIDSVVELRRSYYGIIENTVNSQVFSSMGLMRYMIPKLKDIRKSLFDNKSSFKSKGFTQYIKCFEDVFSDDFLDKLNSIVLSFTESNGGILVSGSLDYNNELTDFTLHKYDNNVMERKEWKKAKRYEIVKMDERAEHEYMRKLDMALADSVCSITDAAKAMLLFIEESYDEMGFYFSALNLLDSLKQKNLNFCFPVIDKKINYEELYDLSLALNKQNVISNTHSLNDKRITLITGANQGGKSTYLRSFGIASLFLQMGLFVPAKAFTSVPFAKIFTHFSREEDSKMESGRLDEELSRMSNIIKEIKPKSLILFNESFVSTNEREGSSIAKEIIDALYDENCYVFFVTHMFELSTILEAKYNDNICFLRASRTRDFHLNLEKALETSFAMDIYKEIFKD